jgi:hypothetical protein
MKRFSWIFLAIALSVIAPVARAQPVTVIINGQTMSFSQPPIERAGRVFVPLRGIFEQLGASVVYASGQINATRHGRTISLSIGSTQATVDGEPTTLDVAPFIVGATTFVPLRFISQALGASVRWDDSTSTVTIAGVGGGLPPQPPPRQAPPPSVVRLVTVWPSGTVYNSTPTIRFQLSRSIRLVELRVTVDGRSVTSGLRQNGPNFALDLPWNLDPGVHRVRVYGTTAAGEPFDLSWNFIRG